MDDYLVGSVRFTPICLCGAQLKQLLQKAWVSLECLQACSSPVTSEDNLVTNNSSNEGERYRCGWYSFPPGCSCSKYSHGSDIADPLFFTTVSVLVRYLLTLGALCCGNLPVVAGEKASGATLDKPSVHL